MTQIEKTPAPGLPKLIIVYFGTNYRGSIFFPVYPNRSGWVPIHPITDQWYIKPTKVGFNCEEHTQTIIPLRLCWNWTIWKYQGQTILVKVSLHLDRGENEHGFSYVAMSCVTFFSDIGLYEDITYKHLFKLICNHKIITPRINAERIFLLYSQ